MDEIDLRSVLEERYLSYALSTIMHRALPDLRDGLKPVHRRLLYAMHMLRLHSGSRFKKCARVVGNVIGQYHPHGDQAVYDSLVRLAQDFSVRYPLIEGQGNFGNIDGDSAAAMRYTESRLTAVADCLLEGLDWDMVDFRETYDGEDREPVILPGSFPNLLANGASGIAVGMACSIPPHNLEEICLGALHLLDHASASVSDLMDYIPGPDFPTGGVIIEDKDSLLSTYMRGRGGVRVRARWDIEEGTRGSWYIVVRELPYQVSKGRLIEKIAELLQSRKLPLLGDIRDESAEDIRLILEPKSRNIDADLLMESLFRLTDLEYRFSVNLNVLSSGLRPNVLSLRDILSEWLSHRFEVLVRRYRHRLGYLDDRLSILSGYLLAYLNLDEVIRIIREEEDARICLMESFSLSERQADSILNMRLRSLRRLEEARLREEYSALEQERIDVEEILSSHSRQKREIRNELKTLCRRFGKSGKEVLQGARLTSFSSAPVLGKARVSEALIIREDVTIVCSQRGWVRALRGHIDDISHLRFKSDDTARFVLQCETTDWLLFFTTSGRMFTLGIDRLSGGRGDGDSLRLLCDISEGEEIISLFSRQALGSHLLLASSVGNGFIACVDDVVSRTRKGKQLMSLSDGTQARCCYPVKDGDNMVASLSSSRKLLFFPLSALPVMSRGKGVRLQRFSRGYLSDAKTFIDSDGLDWVDGAGRNHVISDISPWIGSRAQAGRTVPFGFSRNGRFDSGGLNIPRNK